jgi:hypothetical protein
MALPVNEIISVLQRRGVKSTGVRDGSVCQRQSIEGKGDRFPVLDSNKWGRIKATESGEAGCELRR